MISGACFWLYGLYDYLFSIPKFVLGIFFIFVIFVVGSFFCQSFTRSMKKKRMNRCSSANRSDCSQLITTMSTSTDRTFSTRGNENRMIAAKSFASLRARSKRVPFVRQSLPWDCGLACVLMVLRAHGCQVSSIFFFSTCFYLYFIVFFHRSINV